VTLEARVKKLERAQADKLGDGGQLDLEWWKWRKSIERGDPYDPNPPRGLTPDEWHAEQQGLQDAYHATPEGAAWKAKRDARLALVGEMLDYDHQGPN